MFRRVFTMVSGRIRRHHAEAAIGAVPEEIKEFKDVIKLFKTDAKTASQYYTRGPPDKVNIYSGATRIPCQFAKDPGFEYSQGIEEEERQGYGYVVVDPTTKIELECGCTRVPLPTENRGSYYNEYGAVNFAARHVRGMYKEVEIYNDNESMINMLKGENTSSWNDKDEDEDMKRELVEFLKRKYASLVKFDWVRSRDNEIAHLLAHAGTRLPVPGQVLTLPPPWMRIEL